MEILTENFEEITLDTLDLHVYDLYTVHKPEEHSNLGYLSRKDDKIKVTVGDYDKALKPVTKTRRSKRKNKLINYDDTKLIEHSNVVFELTIEQSVSGISSNNSEYKNNTTGYLLWKVSPIFADWMLNYQDINPFGRLFSNDHKSVVVELGAGVSGVLASTLGTRSQVYITTDQHHLLKILKRNVVSNVDPLKSDSCYNLSVEGSPLTDELNNMNGQGCKRTHKRHPLKHMFHHQDIPHIEVVEYDWERPAETLSNITQYYPLTHEFPDLLIACDTVYNEHLMPMFVEALRTVCGPETIVIVATQLRDPIVVEAFLGEGIKQGFMIYYIMEDHLSNPLRRGFALYYMKLRNTELLQN